MILSKRMRFIALQGICTAILVSLSTLASAQYFNSLSKGWKQHRHTVAFGLGVSNFLGELGGRDQIGTNFIYDLEISQTKPALLLNYRYQLASRLFSKAQFSFGILGGNDNLTEEKFRRNRNLSFRSTLSEFSLGLEFDVLQFTNASRYSVVPVAMKRGYALYISAGIGVATFNPKANFDGSYYALRPLSTEGQGLEEGPEPYKLYTVVLPLGMGFRYNIAKEWIIGAELTHRITFTDYIDDVSTVYFDNDAIREQKGELAGYFADPSLGYYVDENGIEIPLNSTAEGYQRGDADDNDAYLFFTFNVYYRLDKSRGKSGGGRAIKRRKRRTAF